MIKFGDVVLATHGNGDTVKRVFLGTFDNRHLLIYGGLDDEEVEAFYNEAGSPLTYWVDQIEEIVIPTIDIGLNYEDLCTLQRTISEGYTYVKKYKDNNGNDAKLVFMSEDEMKQRKK